MIYLDYTANTPADPAVLNAFIAAEQRYIANPNSTHIAGQQARAEMDRVTSSIAQRLGVQSAEIIYTSGASEANNLAVKGIAQAARHIGKHIISTELEHSSVGASLSVLQQQGYEIDLLRIGRDGRVDLDQLRELLRDDTILVAVCAVDSELGTVQPIREIAELVKAYPGCRLHVDATQAVGKTDLWLDGVDTMSFTAHKFYGLNGIGALYKRRGLVITPQISGGASTTIYRSGTPTLGLAVSLDMALTLAFLGRDAVQGRVCCQPRPPQCAVQLAHQLKPPDDRGRNRRLPAGLRYLLQNPDKQGELTVGTPIRSISKNRAQHHQKISQAAMDALYRGRKAV